MNIKKMCLSMGYLMLIVFGVVSICNDLFDGNKTEMSNCITIISILIVIYSYLHYDKNMS